MSTMIPVRQVNVERLDARRRQRRRARRARTRSSSRSRSRSASRATRSRSRCARRGTIASSCSASSSPRGSSVAPDDVSAMAPCGRTGDEGRENTIEVTLAPGVVPTRRRRRRARSRGAARSRRARAACAGGDRSTTCWRASRRVGESAGVTLAHDTLARPCAGAPRAAAALRADGRVPCGVARHVRRRARRDVRGRRPPQRGRQGRRLARPREARSRSTGACSS